MSASTVANDTTGSWHVSNRRKAIAGLMLLAGLALLPLLTADRFTLSVATTVLITAIAAASLHLIIRTGHVSLAHAAFVGIGAYSSVLVTMNLGAPFIAGFAAAFIVPAALAVLVGALTLRLTGKYFSLVTFLFGEIVRIIFIEWTSVTGGSNGIFQIPAPSPFFANPVTFYYLALFIAAAIIGIIGRILGSEIGATIDAIRQGERLVECTGVPVIRFKIAIFTLACGLAGLSGCLQAHFVRYIDPTSFSTIQSINLVMINIIGGMQSLLGPVIGTFFLVVVPEFLRGYVELQRVIFGVVLIVVMASFTGGMLEIGPKLAAFSQRVFAYGRRK
jgi:branched-chain amino acid transport system permease protein